MAPARRTLKEQNGERGGAGSAVLVLAGLATVGVFLWLRSRTRPAEAAPTSPTPPSEPYMGFPPVVAPEEPVVAPEEPVVAPEPEPEPEPVVAPIPPPKWSVGPIYEPITTTFVWTVTSVDWRADLGTYFYTVYGYSTEGAPSQTYTFSEAIMAQLFTTTPPPTEPTPEPAPTPHFEVGSVIIDSAGTTYTIRERLYDGTAWVYKVDIFDRSDPSNFFFFANQPMSESQLDNVIAGGGRVSSYV